MEAAEPIERRIVTVLFADIVGFTTLSEGLDPEDVATVQDAYFALVRETMARYGGQLEKFIGDAAMAVFGLPRTRDDDAERAVRAGLALTAGVEALTGRLGLDTGTLVVRVGVNTGEVAHATGGPDADRVTGDAVNIAARLQVAADPGTVLAGDATCLAVEEALELAERHALELKGKSEQVGARRVIGVRPERSRDHAMGTMHAPTMGRDAELADLRAALDRTRSDNVERWTVIAPPGVGKSRLVEEVRQGAGTSSVVWRVRLRPDQVGPYEPVAELMRLGLDGAAPADAPLEAGGIATERGSVLRAGIEALFAAAPSGSVAADTGRLAEAREERFDAWIEVLDVLAGERAQVWIADDLHWAGGDVLAFLLRAGSLAARHGRLVIGTARPSLLEQAPGWPEEAGGHRMDLSPLAAPAASALIRALVGDGLPVALVDDIAKRADGNPLFIEELLRTWVSVGILAHDAASSWRLTVEPGQLTLPPTVQAIYAAQLDDLPDGARNVARRGSVAGRRFPVAALGELGVAEDATRSGLRTLSERALVAGPDEEAVGGATYSYRHALLRDAGYASLAKAERARLHVRLARWLEQVAGDRSGAVAELIGGHYASAVASASALSSTIGEGLERDEAGGLAARWLEQAAAHSLQLSAYDAAASLLRRAADMTPVADRTDRARRLVLLGQAVAPSGDADSAQAAFAEAREIYGGYLGGDDAGDARRGYAQASFAASQLLLEQLRFRDAAALAAEALERIGSGDDPSAARLLLARAQGDWFESNDAAPLASVVERVLYVAARHADGDLELDALRLRSNVSLEQGVVDAEGEERFVALAADLGRWPLVVSSLTNRAAMLMDQRLAQVGPKLDEAERIARTHGLTQSRAWIAFTRAETHLLSGEWDLAVGEAGEALDLGISHGYVRATVRTWFTLRPIIARRGDLVRMGRMDTWFDQLASVPDSPYGRLMHGAVDLDRRALLGRDLEMAEPGRLRDAWALSYDDPSWVAARDRVLEAWLASGLVDAVRDANATIAASILPAAAPLAHGSVRLWAARLLRAEGGRARSGKAAREALSAFRSTFARWWIAQAIDLLEDLGAATEAESAERGEIERQLAAAM